MDSLSTVVYMVYSLSVRVKLLQHQLTHLQSHVLVIWDNYSNLGLLDFALFSTSSKREILLDRQPRKSLEKSNLRSGFRYP
jgi:hypothetical protein